jgi:uncharacterized protein YabN with tetrapyrrole methylase and pyrophosphatase domain
MSDRAGQEAPALERLGEITRRLRRECPWDREQDERSIVSHTVEEAYELADAARRGDDERLLDELGDVLFQVHFLALLLEERGAGDLEAIAEGMSEKLIRRHPHVFGAEAGEASARVLGGRSVSSAGEVLGNWDRIKREVEGRGADDPFADVPESLPALLYARRLLRRAASLREEDRGASPADRTGPPPPGRQAEPASDQRAALARAGAALERLGGAAPAAGDAGADADPRHRGEVERALGDLLLAIVDASRLLRADPELALRAAADRLRGEAPR